MLQQLNLNDIEHNQLIHEFNNTYREYPQNKVFQELFEEQVEKTPNNLAVISKDKKLTYSELNRQTNQLARALRSIGVRQDQIIGLMVNDNTIEMIIGMISILKAGGAFLPLDSTFPSERIEHMIKDSKITVLLSQGKLKEEIKFDGYVINLENQNLYEGNNSNLEKINQPNNLAYVIYTSGSTGKPKGVQIEHTSIVNQIFGLEELYTFNDSMHHILLAPATFDPSVQQIFLPLTSGGKLFLVSESTKRNVKELLDFIVSNRIDIINTVPSLMNVLLDHMDEYGEQRFLYIILAGESFSRNLYLKLKEKLSAEKIINIYGPTEATINTTLYECNSEEFNDSIPIGKPLMNYNVFILDEEGNFTSIGVPGEICISGVGLARGYLNNPELTEEKFVANPFQPGERMYLTGDLGKWTSDGNIQFLGRVDHQVKINGMRVELGEIENAIVQHPGVQKALVTSKKDNTGLLHLVAYVVANQKQNINVDELRSFIKGKLPGYMIPATFVIMDDFPLTHHGKVDRRALPDPDQNNLQQIERYIPPRVEIESQLAEIWEKVLGIKPIGVRDEFFSLGGTSLLAMEIFAQIEMKFDRRIPIAILIDAPTIEKLAKIIAGSEDLDYWSSLVAIQPEGSKPPFFCIHGAGGNVLIYRDLASHLGLDQPLYGLQSQGMNGMDPFHTSVENMAAHYIKVIQTIQPDGPYLLGGYCMGGSIAYEMAQQLNAQGKKVALVVLMETYNFCECKPQSFIDNFQYNTERIEFQIRNFLLLKTRDKITYIKEKFLVAKRRRHVWLGMLKMRIGRIIGYNNNNKSYLYKLRKTNEQAADNYIPKVYSGKVVDFKTISEFSRYKKPESGLDNLAIGEIEKQVLKVYPTGTLIEPFVKLMAEKLKSFIQQALEEVK